MNSVNFHSDYERLGSPFGLDLAAINIQRGRDHGIPPYVAWRKPCGLSPVNNWEDLDRVMSADTAGRLRATYNSVEDIDLYSAGLAEKPVRGGLVGPTFACIIAQQFSNLRKGDRFWYENGGFESSFSPAQLQQIRKLTFSTIICRTLTEIETLQPFVFMAPDMDRNRREKCQDLLGFDLAAWTEQIPNVVPKFRDNLRPSNQNVSPSNITPMQARFLKDDQPNKTAPNRPKLTKRHVNQIPFVELLTDFDTPENRTTDDALTDRTGKRKRQGNKRKTKPKRRPSTQSTKKVKQRPISSTAPPEEYYYGPSYNVGFIPEAPTYRPPTIHVNTNKPMHDNQEISIIVPAQRPEELGYLINTVTKRPVAGTSKPDYNIHIQINYYLNSTDKKPTRPQGDYLEQISYNSDNPNNPYRPTIVTYDNVGYGQTTTKRPYYSSGTSPYYPTTAYTTKRPTRRPTTTRPYFSTTTTYYSTTRRPIYSTTTTKYSTRVTTQRPYYSNKPYVLAHSHPVSVVQRPATTKRPSVIIIENASPAHTRPNYYNDFYKPYDYIDDDYESKRPMLGTFGTVMKLDNRPNMYSTNDHSLEVPHRIYYINGVYNPNRQGVTDVDDKLDFSPHLYDPDKHYVPFQYSTNRRPFDTETSKKFVKISSVHGHTTSTKHFEPVFVAVQQRKGDTNLKAGSSDNHELHSKMENNRKSDELHAENR